jgi:hypothetical protein
MMTPTTLTLIDLALARPRTRIRRRGGGHAVRRLIHRRHGRRRWCQLCLHLQDDGAKDDGRGSRRSQCANIRGREEVGQHDPVGVEQQKQKQKQTQKKTQNQQRGDNVTASAPSDSYAHAAAAPASA